MKGPRCYKDTFNGTRLGSGIFCFYWDRPLKINIQRLDTFYLDFLLLIFFM